MVEVATQDRTGWSQVVECLVVKQCPVKTSVILLNIKKARTALRY